MERSTALYSEMDFVANFMNADMQKWLGLPEKHRMVWMEWYRLHLAKKAYANTPEKDRFLFFAKL